MKSPLHGRLWTYLAWWHGACLLNQGVALDDVMGGQGTPPAWYAFCAEWAIR